MKLQNDTCIAIPSNSDEGLNAQVMDRFGRCPFFTIVRFIDNEIEEVRIIENPGAQAKGGAGPIAAQTLEDEGVHIVIGGQYGPNALKTLLTAHVEPYGPSNSENLTIATIIHEFLSDQLERVTN